MARGDARHAGAHPRALFRRPPRVRRRQRPAALGAAAHVARRHRGSSTSWSAPTSTSSPRGQPWVPGDVPGLLRRRCTLALSDLTLARDTNFYYSFLVLPPAKRQAIVAVWDFCRAVDDAVDEVGEAGDAAQRGRALAAGSCATASKAGRRRRRRDARWRRSSASSTSAAAVRGAHRGRRDGSRDRRYETFADLYEYCIRVASAVGLMCLEIFGYRDPASRQYATDLGVALQLTNILRDVPGRSRARPHLHSAGGSARARVHGRGPAARGEQRRRRRPVAGRQGAAAPAGRAGPRLLRRAGQALPREDARQLVAAEIMGAIYRAMLDAHRAARLRRVHARSCASRGRGARVHRRWRPGPHARRAGYAPRPHATPIR